MLHTKKQIKNYQTIVTLHSFHSYHQSLEGWQRTGASRARDSSAWLEEAAAGMDPGWLAQPPLEDVASLSLAKEFLGRDFLISARKKKA